MKKLNYKKMGNLENIICIWKYSYFQESSTFQDVKYNDHPLYKCVQCKDYDINSQCETKKLYDNILKQIIKYN